jgi:peptidoglycan hydrolase-like protein with peptidoglycan-binding domain
MSQSEDMTAINKYMSSAKPNNDAAAALRDTFVNWYKGLGWYDITVASDAYNKARDMRTAFNAAQGTPEMVSGMTTEQMQGKAPTIAASKQARDVLFLQKGSTGPNVVKWQKIIGVKADGKFGAGTGAATKKWRVARGLTAVEYVDRDAWKAAEAGVKPRLAPQEVAAVIQAPPKPTPVRIVTPTGQSTGAKPAVMPKPAKTPVAVQSSAPLAVVEKAKVMQASVLSGITGWPIWAKILGGAVLIGGVTYGLTAEENRPRGRYR